MFKIIKDFNWIIASSFLCILLGILTFLTFINQGFIPLNDKNLQILLIIDIILLLIFFSLIFKNTYRFYRAEKRKKTGSQTNLKYISLFSLFTFLPSLLIAIFSLFLFNFGLQKFFNDQNGLPNGNWNIFKKIMNKKNVVRKGCLLLPLKTLLKALNN